MLKPRAILFDFDGTLVDSFSGIEVAVRQAVAELMPDRELPPLRPLIGPALMGMLKIALPGARAEELESVATRFKSLYDSGLCLECQLYPEVHVTLGDLLQAEGAPRSFIVTNKRYTPTRLLLDHFGIATWFEDIIASDHPRPFAHKGEAVAWTLAEYGLDAAGTWFVGDSQDDYEAASQNGLYFVPVAYGYGNAPTHTSTAPLGNFKELSSLLQQCIAP